MSPSYSLRHQTTLPAGVSHGYSVKATFRGWAWSAWYGGNRRTGRHLDHPTPERQAQRAEQELVAEVRHMTLPRSSDTTTLYVRIPVDLKQQLDGLCSQTDLTLAALCSLLLREAASRFQGLRVDWSNG